MLRGTDQRLSSDLVVFPVPDVECRLLEGLDRLLRQRVLYRGDQQSADTHELHRIPSNGVAINIPLGNSGHPVSG